MRHRPGTTPRLATWLLALATIAPAQALSAREPEPAEAMLPEGLATLVIRLAPEASLASWQLAHKLAFGAQGARAIKHVYWVPLKAAFDSVPVAEQDRTESRMVGGHRIYISKVQEKDRVKATLRLPEALIQPLQAKYKGEVQTAFTRTRSATQEVTTWPTRAKLDYANEVSEDRTFEWNATYAHSRIWTKTRPSFKDEPGQVIRFTDLTSTLVQDNRAGTLGSAYLFCTGRGTALGRVDTGLLAGVDWARDPINFLDRRTTPYAGINVRFSSERVDDQRLELGLRIARNSERYSLLEPVLDDSGVQTGTTAMVEEYRLTCWQVDGSWRLPLYRFENVPMVILEGQASWMESFNRVAGQAGRPDQTERIATADLGLVFQTPMGAAVRLGARINWNRLPGMAGEMVEGLQLVTMATAAVRFKF